MVGPRRDGGFFRVPTIPLRLEPSTCWFGSFGPTGVDRADDDPRSLVVRTGALVGTTWSCPGICGCSRTRIGDVLEFGRTLS